MAVSANKQLLFKEGGKMKNIFIVMALIGAGLLSLDASAAGGGGTTPAYRGYTLKTNLICSNSHGSIQTYNPGFDYYGYFNVDDFASSVLKYQQVSFRLFGYLPVNTIEGKFEQITIHYANGSDFTRVMDVSINGVVVAPNLQFPTTYGWDVWADKVFYADIGDMGAAQQFRLHSVNPEGGPNVNWINVGYATQPGPCPSRNGCGSSLNTGGTFSCNY
jgi:hypothetical protein